MYVNDMVIIGNDPEYIAFVNARPSELFLMFDLDPLLYFLGIEVSSTSNGFLISQEMYLQDLARIAFIDKRNVKTPMELNIHLCAPEDLPLSVFNMLSSSC